MLWTPTEQDIDLQQEVSDCVYRLVFSKSSPINKVPRPTNMGVLRTALDSLAKQTVTELSRLTRPTSIKNVAVTDVSMVAGRVAVKIKVFTSKTTFEETYTF